MNNNQEDFQPLPLTRCALEEAIVNDTPFYTQQLLMELNPGYWGRFFPHLIKEKIRIVK